MEPQIKHVDERIKLIGDTYQHAQGYTNVVMLAGYAGLFALWTLVKDELPRVAVLTTGLLAVISVSTFVLWEVYQMFFRSRYLFRWSEALMADPDSFPDAAAQYQAWVGKQFIQLKRAWRVAFGLSAGTGVTAAAVLIATFTIELVKEFC